MLSLSKELENLGFREFVKAYGDNIAVLYKNKYANGVDRYNYFKKMDNFEPLVVTCINSLQKADSCQNI